jgi:hypothetical protein
VYALSEQGIGPLAGRFASFEHALAAGDDLARGRRVRLFYQESSGGPTQLLRDYRPKWRHAGARSSGVPKQQERDRL